MTGSAGKRGSVLSSSSAALSFFPVALLRDVLSFFASFLGVFVTHKGSSVQQLYTSTFTWKSGLASSLKGEEKISEQLLINPVYSQGLLLLLYGLNNIYF